MRKKIILLSCLFLGIYLLIKSLYSNKVNNKAPSLKVVSDKKSSKIFKRISDKRKTIKQTKKEIVSTSTKLYFKAMKVYGTKEYETYLRESLSSNPNNLDTLGRLSEYLLNQGEIEESRGLAIHCLAIDSRNEICHRTIISSFTRHGEFEESFYYLRDCLNEYPNNIHCNSAMVSYHLNTGNDIEAEKILSSIKENDQNKLWLSISNGDLLIFRKEYKKALLYYKRACELKNSYACSMVKKLKN